MFKVSIHTHNKSFCIIVCFSALSLGNGLSCVLFITPANEVLFYHCLYVCLLGLCKYNWLNFPENSQRWVLVELGSHSAFKKIWSIVWIPKKSEFSCIIVIT